MRPMSGLYSLFQPHSGLFTRTEVHRAAADEPEIITRTIHPDPLRDDSLPGRKTILLSGSGTAVHEEDTWVPALAEALERYCATVYSEDQFIWASANELRARAIDQDSFPVCSERELQNPACQLRRPSKEEKIRWVQGLSLSDGSLVYLPLVSIYITHPAAKAERFVNAISTGCAAHTSYETAILSAILEVIERDALSIAWLQKLQLPRIDLEDPIAALGELWERYQCSSKAIQVTFFDATTDLGVPTIYGLRVSSLDKQLHTVVACSSSLDPATACRKVMLELAACSAWLRRVGPVPDNEEDFNQLYHGASYMAREQQANAFDFLLDGPTRVPLAHVAANSPALSTHDSRTALAKVLAHLTTLGHSIYAADLSTDEALRADMRVVRVIIPSLMPFSWVQRARFLGHPRLYDAPRAMGFPVRDEPEINPWPQPFG
jgi:ribosomal protein S12 methylthiotransferase accessory factor